MATKSCSKCNAPFACGNENPGCWCEGVYIGIETLGKLRTQYDNCLCRECLQTYAESENIDKK